MRTALKDRAGVSERAMFGGYCWMLNGNMICGVEVGRFMFRVGKPRMAEALARDGAEPVVFSGRTMGGFVWVEADACIDAGIDDWIEYAQAFVGALPPK
jgi:hypothetical protein